MSAQPGGHLSSSEEYVFVDAPEPVGLINDAGPGSPVEIGLEAGAEAQQTNFDSQPQLAAPAEQGPPHAATETGEETALENPSG